MLRTIDISTNFGDMVNLKYFRSAYDTCTSDASYGAIHLLNNAKFPKLEQFRLKVPYHRSLENAFINSFVTFLRNHEKTLSQLFVQFLSRRTGPPSSNDKYDAYITRNNPWPDVPDIETSEAELSLMSLKCLRFYYTNEIPPKI